MRNIKEIITIIKKKTEDDGIEKNVVGGIIIKEKKLVLLLKRAKNEFYGGFYDFPSGKVKKKENWEDALNREIREETNLKMLTISDYIGNFDYISSKNKRTRQHNFLVVVDDYNLTLSSEHQSYLWYDLSLEDDANSIFDLTMKKQLAELNFFLKNKYGIKK